MSDKRRSNSLAPISERNRVIYACAGLVLYVAGVFMLVPHGVVASPMLAPVPAPSLPPIVGVERSVPRLNRDVFAVPDFAAIVEGQTEASPAPAPPTPCSIQVIGTVVIDARSSPGMQSAAQIRQNDGAAQRVGVGDTVCSGVVTAISLGGVTVGSTFIAVSSRNDDLGLRTPLEGNESTPAPSPDPSSPITPASTPTPGRP
jgi:hypothetical protein